MLRSSNFGFFEVKKRHLLCLGIICLFKFSTNAEDIEKSHIGAKLDIVQRREMIAREQIALEQAKVENLKQDIQACTRKIADALKVRYKLLNTDEQGYLSVVGKLDSIILNYRHFQSSGASEIFDKRHDIDSLYSFIVGLKDTTRFAQLDLMAKKMQSIQDLYAEISDSIAMFQKHNILDQVLTGLDSSEVEQGENIVSSEESELVTTWVVSSDLHVRESLSMIAGYPQVYGDPYQWRKIYFANKNLIDKNYQRLQKYQKTKVSVNPQDILFPGQILKIPR